MSTFGMRALRPGVGLAPASGPAVDEGRPVALDTGAPPGVQAPERQEAGTSLAGPPGEGNEPDRQPIWRRLRLPLIAALVVLLALLLLALAHSRSVHGQLDPRAADGQGSRALATLLGDRNVAVQR